MTATNHVLTGSVFAVATVNVLPLWILLPTAFLLHFVLDSLPHFGEPGKENEAKALNRLRWLLPFDALVALLVLLAIFIVKPEHWLVLEAAGILCASPDLWSAARFWRFLKKGATHINNDWFARFHSKIQWGERLWGAWVELVWFGGMAFLLITYLART